MSYEVHTLHVGTITVRGEEEPVHAWLVKGHDRTMLFDGGLPEPDVVATRWNTPCSRGGVKPFVDELAECGVKPEEVDTLVLSHLHFDHAWHLDLFPNALAVVQRLEVISAIDPVPTHRGFYNQKLNAALIQRKRPDRLLIIDGDHRLAPGVDLKLTPGHTPGMMALVAETAKGRVGLSSDGGERYANWFPADPRANPKPVRFLAGGTMPPHISTESVQTCLASQRRLREVSDIIVPSHDWRIPKHMPAQWWAIPE